MKGRCIIISGSPEFEPPAPDSDDYIIACDSGYLNAVKADITPDLLIGDFDSYLGTIKAGIDVIRASAVKDDTDTMLAVKFALNKGYRSFALYGATGGRLDHQAANIAAGAYIAENGGLCELIDNRNRMILFKNSSVTLPSEKNKSVSIFSYTDCCHGVTLKGLKYELNNASLTNTVPLGVSNEFNGEPAFVEVKSGILLIILSDLR